MLTWRLFWGGGIIISCFSGCISSGPVREHWSQTYNSEKYGESQEAIEKHFNLHRGRWWNYYARGKWYLELEFHAAAAEDFRQAIDLRNTDKRRARSYGMHFWDYFPHRELGIALFRQKLYFESLQELENSFQMEESARTKFYLNQARSLYLKQTGVDTIAPEIFLEIDAEKILTNQRIYRIRGTVKDDHFVRTVTIGNQDLFIELAQPNIELDREIQILPGENKISIIAEDIVGHRSHKEFFVTLDLIPPVICINKISFKSVSQKNIILDVTVLDNISLKEIQIGNQQYSGDSLPQKIFRQIQLSSTGDMVPISATDSAGNTTTTTIPHSLIPGVSNSLIPNSMHQKHFAYDKSVFLSAYGKTKPANGSLIQDSFLSLHRNPINPAISSMPIKLTWGTPIYSMITQDTAAPRLDVGTQSVSTVTVMEDRYFVDGKAYDPSGIKEILVNGVSLPVSQKAVLVAFNHYVSLQPGNNEILVEITNNAGKRSSKTLNVFREEPEILRSSARYSIALLPLNEKGIERNTAPLVYNKIILALTEEPQRFRLVEREEHQIRKLLEEQTLASHAENRTAIRIGKLISAEGMLFGDIEEGNKDITIDLRFVDVETGQILLATDVYGENKETKYLSWLTEGLISKVKRTFPLVQGDVVDIDEGIAYINLGRDHHLRQGMKLLFYREKQIGKLSIKKLLKKQDKPIGGRVADLDTRTSSAKFYDKKAASVIQVGDKVITK